MLKKIYLGYQEIHLDESVLKRNLTIMKDCLFAGGCPMTSVIVLGWVVMCLIYKLMENLKKTFISPDGEYHQLRDQAGNLVTLICSISIRLIVLSPAYQSIMGDIIQNKDKLLDCLY